MNRRTAIFSLMGSALAAFAGITIYKFCELYQRPELYYLDAKKALIAEIADTIIPRTDTPGAKDVYAENFIINMIKDCTETRSQNRFIYGLKGLEKYTLKTFKKDYISCNNTQRIAVLTHLENQEKTRPLLDKVRHKLLGDSFMYLFKYYTVIGYCTSEEGAKKGLAYDYIPGSYDACIPLTSHQKCWATE